MTCRRCHQKIEDFQTRCPNCGDINENASGMFQTSTVLISASGTDQVFRSVSEVPVGLRTRLLKSTNSANSATILIADRRGRKEIAKAMRHLPRPIQRRWMRTLMTAGVPAPAMEWLTPARRRVILALVALLMIAAIALVFTRTA